MSETECYRCGRTADETRTIDGIEQPICELCNYAWDIMSDTRKPVELFGDAETAMLVNDARTLARRVLER